jgi:DNA-binding transcriptional ArsR family regulator
LVTVIGNRMVANTTKQRDAVFRALSDPTRREILGILRGGQQSVGTIARNFHMSRPAISKHLRMLHTAGLVEQRRQGTANVCSLNAKPLTMIDDWLYDYEAFWSASLNRLKKYVEENK